MDEEDDLSIKMTTECLLENFLSTSNFLSAYRRIASKGASGGIDGVSVEAFGRRLDQNIRRLQEEIRNRRYIPQPTTTAYIPKFNKENEWRELGLSTVADKIVQAALLEVVQPIAEKKFLDCSYAYRPGKGHYKAIRRVEHSLNNQKKTWAVQRDIDNFFYTLNHNRLISQFAELVDGEPIMTELVVLWCKMGLTGKDGRWRDVQSGVRQGHVISPLLANLYLHPLDEFATNLCLRHAGMRLKIEWIRYADDYLILTDTKEESSFADIQIEGFLKDKLSLQLNKLVPAHLISRESDYLRHIDEGFTFLGIHFCGKVRTIDPAKIEKMEKKVRWLLSEKNKGNSQEIIVKLREKIDSWQRYYGFLNPAEQFAQLDAFIEKEFLSLLTIRIREGRWQETPPEGIAFPSLKVSSSENAVKKMKGLWKEAIRSIKTHEVDELKHSADEKIRNRRRKYKRDSGQNGNLIVTTPGHFIGKRGDRVVVMNKQKIVGELPSIKLTGLTLSGRGVSISGDVIELCMRKDIYIHLVDHYGKIFAVVNPPGGSSGNVSLLQVAERDKEKGLTLARLFIIGKVRNQFTLLKYYFKYPVNRENCFGKIFMEKRNYLEDIIKMVKGVTDRSDPQTFRQRLLGLEGTFGATYWGIIKHLLRNGIEFSGRMRYGADDLVNSALNYGYGILYGHCLNAIIRTGLNPMMGFLHSCQPGKTVLVYDLIEEFRPFVVDRSIFSMLNRDERLEQEEDGFLTSESRKRIAKLVVGRLSSEVWFRGRRLTMDEVIHEQAQNIKKHLQGSIQYRPYLGRW